MWTCHRSGDCCTKPAAVVVSQSERRVLQDAAERLGLTLQWRAGDRPRFTSLVARPCPFYEASVGCRVYEERPFNCRRYMCGRDDLSEPYDANTMHGIPMRVLTSADLRSDYMVQQAEAHKWADAHGWGADV